MTERFKDMAQRAENAHDRLVGMLADAGQISTNNANIVADYYLKHKLAKLSYNDGQATIKHGAFLEIDVIKRALTQAKKDL